MGPPEINDDHAAELSDLRDVRGVVHRLRQLLAAAFEVNPLTAGQFEEPLYETYQSAPGR